MYVMFQGEKKLPDGLADVDMPVLTHITRECTNGGTLVREKQRLLQSETRYQGSQTKEACVLHMILNYITSV